MQLEIDSELNYTVDDEGCSPIVFVPDINLYELEDPSIINAF
jgi:hypothetical protein